MSEQALYRHRRTTPWSTVVMALALLLPGLWVMRDDLFDWLLAWPLHLGALTLVAWHWFMVGRHLHRPVRVDQRGLWVDGEVVARPGDIEALAFVADEFWSFRQKRIDKLTGEPRSHRGGIGNQKCWVRVFEAPGLDHLAAVTRQKDLARGGWRTGILVQTSRSLAPGFRDSWVIASGRPDELFSALQAIAPRAQLPDPRQVDRPARGGVGEG